MSKKSVIINFGSGNILSVKRAIEYLGFEAEISSEKEKILNADRVILPGVGHFGAAIKNLTSIKNEIHEFIKKQRPFMGVCLGMQLLYNKSEENNFKEKGFEIFNGNAVKLPSKPNFIVPHIGWAKLNFDKGFKNEKIFKNINNNSRFYFVHSYHCEDADANSQKTYTNYNAFNFVSSATKDNVFAFQFHPEKSSKDGLQIYKNFFNV
jgi:glutamine amidotransferase